MKRDIKCTIALLKNECPKAMRESFYLEHNFITESNRLLWFSPVILLRIDGLSSSEVSMVKGEDIFESKFLSSSTIRMLPILFQSESKETQGCTKAS